MKRIVLLALIMASVCVCALASTPSTWSAFVSDWHGLAPQNSIPNDTFTPRIATFTPDATTTVTRIEIVEGSGPFGNGPNGACTINPSLTIQGGTTTYTLPIATPQNLNTPPGGIGHSETDSGPLSLQFAAGTRIALIGNQGDADCSPGILANITVQYHSTDQNMQ